ncbi:MAG: hypothetical protein JHC33_13780 [Ignisphaera sp.]|nr:hypothetical protein [Ignisphaera sp.]
MNNYIVYKYTSPSGKHYIGKTINESRRKSRHIQDAKRGSNLPFHIAIRKYGIDAFTYEVIVCNVPEYLINPFEKYWINFYHAYSIGYNCTIGGEGIAGRRHTENTKRIISEARKGNKDWLGKTHSKTSIIKMSIVKLGGSNPCAIPVINLSTSEVFPSGADAAKSIGLCTRAITKAIRLHTKSGGYYWAKYKIKENDG